VWLRLQGTPASRQFSRMDYDALPDDIKRQVAAAKARADAEAKGGPDPDNYAKPAYWLHRLEVTKNTNAKGTSDGEVAEGGGRQSYTAQVMPPDIPHWSELVQLVEPFASVAEMIEHQQSKDDMGRSRMANDPVY